MMIMPHDVWEVPDATVPVLWFRDNGFHVFPTCDKVPAVPKGTSQFDFRCSREHAACFREYGVPLSTSLGVVDTDSPETERWVLQQVANGTVPKTPLVVTTARGKHRYFRLTGAVPKFLHRDGHTIEFKNIGQYVVGPGSRRPDGVVYIADAWSWNIDDIPFFPADFVFDDRPTKPCGSTDGARFEFPQEVHAGERHYMLFRQIRAWRHIFDESEAREGIHVMNQACCRPPLTEDEKFEQWFLRAWNQPDRPLPEGAPSVPTLPRLTRLRGLSWRST